MNSEEIIWTYLRNEGLTEYATAGVMGNLYAESGLQSNILQINYQSSLGMSSEQYTAAVDNGSYNNFVSDAAGYGLAQWTFWSRKQDLLTKAKGMNVSIGDLIMQLEFLCYELQEYGLWNKLNACQSVQDASNIILFEYEKPRDMGVSVQNARANWGQGYYNKYAGKQITQEPVTVHPPAVTDKYCVIAFRKCNDLNQAKELSNILKTYAFEGIVTQVVG